MQAQVPWIHTRGIAHMALIEQDTGADPDDGFGIDPEGSVHPAPKLPIHFRLSADVYWVQGYPDKLYDSYQDAVRAAERLYTG